MASSAHRRRARPGYRGLAGIAGRMVSTRGAVKAAAPATRSKNIPIAAGGNSAVPDRHVPVTPVARELATGCAGSPWLGLASKRHAAPWADLQPLDVARCRVACPLPTGSPAPTACTVVCYPRAGRVGIAWLGSPRALWSGQLDAGSTQGIAPIGSWLSRNALRPANQACASDRQGACAGVAVLQIQVDMETWTPRSAPLVAERSERPSAGSRDPCFEEVAGVPSQADCNCA
jgi:hypothetical protein